MALSHLTNAEDLGHEHILPNSYQTHVNPNAVSWAVILAGAIAAAALSLILLLLGAGLGLSSALPWA